MLPWVGNRSFVHKEGDDPVKGAEKDAMAFTGSSHCSVRLLHSFYMNVRLGEPFQSLLSFDKD